MRIIGLTGPSGAGKSTLCKRFEELSIPCINTDEIYHVLTASSSPCLEELKAKFGNEIISENGSLNRTALAKIVFEDENSAENLEALNQITHKHVFRETNAILTQYMNDGKKAAVIDAPALFSSEAFVNACDFILSVLCNKDLRIQRIMARDGISHEKALARINSQPDDSFFIEHSDYCIYNLDTEALMCNQLDSILEKEGLAFNE